MSQSTGFWALQGPWAHTSLQAPQTHHAEGQAVPPAEDSLLWEEDEADPCHGRLQPHLHQ